MIIAFSDLHVHNNARFGDGTERLKDFIRALNLVCVMARKANVEAVVFCGDLYQKHGMVPAEVLTGVMRILYEFNSTGIPFLAISGNHDIPTKPAWGVKFHTALEHLDIALDNFVLLDFSQEFIGDYNFIGLPYMGSQADFEKALNQSALPKLESGYTNVLLTHNTPSDLGEFGGFEIDTKNPKLQEFDLILNGHIHKKRRSMSNFYTLGNPLQLDADDIGQEKGVWFLGKAGPTSMKFYKMNKYFPEIKVVTSSSDREEGELAIVKPPEITMQGSVVAQAISDFKDYNDLFGKYVTQVDVGDLDEKILLQIIEEV